MKNKPIEVIVIGKPDLNMLDETSKNIFYSELLSAFLKHISKEDGEDEGENN